MLSFSAIFIAGCKKEDVVNDPANSLKKIASSYAIGAGTKVTIYAKDSLFTGYNKLYIALTDSLTGAYIEEAHVVLSPTMVMTSMSHAAPFENPSSGNASNSLFPCSVTFIMSSMAGTWNLNVSVHNHKNGKEGVAAFGLTVKDPASPKLFSFVSASDGGKYFVAYINPEEPKVGINDMEIAIYKKQSMMSFPADSSLSVSVTPEMPTMGHGSPNNIDPVHVGNGHYKGKVNFTMTGLWRLHLDFKMNTAVADDTHYFDITF